jgi:excisionase family DNA binding protein
MMKDRSSGSNLLLQPELYRVPDAATVLGVSERMIYTFIKDGVLVATYLPGTGTKRAPVRIARTDLLAFIERCRGVRA